MNDVSHWDYLDDGCPTRQKVSPVVAGHWWSSERNAVGRWTCRGFHDKVLRNQCRESVRHMTQIEL